MSLMFTRDIANGDGQRRELSRASRRYTQANTAEDVPEIIRTRRLIIDAWKRLVDTTDGFRNHTDASRVHMDLDR